MLSLVMVSCKKEELPIDVNQSELDPELETGYYYASDETGKFEVWQSEKGELKQVTESQDQDNWWPRISPDQKELLFYRSAAGRDINDYSSAALWKRNLEDGTEQEVFAFGANNWKFQGLANWSHNGEWIVMAASDQELQRWQIYVCNAAGEELRRVSLRDGYDYLDPVFSLDDHTIYCVAVPEDEGPSSENYEIFALDVNTGEEIRLTFNETRDHHPDVSPDGEKLVFESMIDPDYLGIGKWVLKEFNLSTKDESLLLEDNNLNFYPRYSADGKAVFYVGLNVTLFNMTVSKLTLSDGKTSRLLSDSYNSMSVDPY